MANKALFRCVASVSRQLQRRVVVTSVRFSTACLNKPHTLTAPQQLETHMRPLCTKPNTDFIINIQDEEDFEKQVMQNSKPVVVDFHAQ